MGTSVGPLEALAGLISGVSEGTEQKRARARQAKLDAAARTDKDRAYGLDKAANSITRAKTITEEGLVPDTGMLAPGDLQPPDLSAQTYARALKENPNMSPPDVGIFGALTAAFDRTKAQPRISILDPTGQTSQTFRQGTPLRERLEQERQQGTDNRLREKEAADAKRVTDLEAQRARDAEAKAVEATKRTRQDAFTFLSTKPGYLKLPMYRTFNPAFPYEQEQKVYEAQVSKPDKADSARGEFTIKDTDKEGNLVFRDVHDPTKFIKVEGEKSAGAGGKNGIMGGMAARAGANAAGALNAMEHANDLMKPMEKEIIAGKIPLTGVDEFLTKMQGVESPSRGGFHPVDATSETSAMRQLAKKNPALARYVRLGLQYGVDESAFTGRGSDFRTKLMDVLSRAHTGYTKDMVEDVGTYRESLIKGYRTYFPKSETGLAPVVGAGGKSGGAGDKIDPAHFALLSKEDQDYFRKMGRAP